jgi:multicomponent K+:H+ antiporter subunit A
MTLALILLLPFIGSICAALMPSNARNAEAWLAGAFTLASALLLIHMYPQIQDEGVVRADVAWIPQLGLDLQLRIDGFAWMFAMLITGIGALVVFYARYYLSPADPVPRARIVVADGADRRGDDKLAHSQRLSSSP